MHTDARISLTPGQRLRSVQPDSDLCARVQQPALCVDRRKRSPAGAVEGREKAIALRVDLAAGVGCDRCP